MPSGLIHLPKSASVLPVTFQNSFAPISNTNSFSTTLSASGTIDLSTYSGLSNPALVIALNWYANGGGISGSGFLTCTFNSANLTLMGQGGNRANGDNWGSVLYIMTGVSLISATLAVSQSGTSNTGRNIWASAWLFSNVGGYDNVSGFYSQPSGTAINIPCGVGDWGVNVFNAGAALTYNQTLRQSGTIGGNMRAYNGDAQGDASGNKSFIATGTGYQSVAARLYSAA